MTKPTRSDGSRGHSEVDGGGEIGRREDDSVRARGKLLNQARSHLLHVESGTWTEAYPVEAVARQVMDVTQQPAPLKVIHV